MSDPAAHSFADLPAWLAQVDAALNDGQDAGAARDWARSVHSELERLGGRVPFGVVHDWHAHAVAPMLAEAATRRGADAGAQQAVRLLHVRALAGERVGEGEWAAALRPALRETYRHAYAYADAYATAYASAYDYGMANGYTAAEAVEFGHTYAKLNTSSNVQAYAEAHAIANAWGLASAYARADADAYAEAYPFAHVNAYAHAWANSVDAAHQGGLADPNDAPDSNSAADPNGAAGPTGAADRAERRRAAYRRLADGLVESLGRAVA